MSKADWEINIKNSASAVSSIMDAKTVEFVFQKYGASDFDDLSPSQYAEVWDDLDFMASNN
jgi:hypothetical protein